MEYCLGYNMIILNLPLLNPLFYIVVTLLWLYGLKLDGFSHFNKKKREENEDDGR